MTSRWPRRAARSVPPTLVVVGPTHFDLLVKLPRLPRPNDRLVPTDVALEPGGMGGNVASAFARLGGRARYAGTLPGDDDGPLLRAALERDGVVTRYACTRSGPSSRGLILVGQRGERAIVGGWRRLLEAHLRPIGSSATDSGNGNGHLAAADEITRWRSLTAGPWDLASGALGSPVDALYCPSIFAPGVLPALPHDLPLVIDIEARHTDEMAPDDVRALLRRASLVFGNEGVLAGVADRLGYADAARLGNDVGGTLVVTRGARGCLVVGDTVTHVPGLRVRPVDTTGAGDCFAGAFTLGALRGLEPIQAATFANIAAALSTRGLGCRAATPTLEDVRTTLARRARRDRRASKNLSTTNHTDNPTAALCKALQIWQDHAGGQASRLAAREVRWTDSSASKP